MKTITVDRGIPIPKPVVTTGGKTPKYPWRTMQIGESFFVKKPSYVFRNYCYNTGVRCGRKFSCRAEGNGTRVWRVG